jgi:hypothetical protein
MKPSNLLLDTVEYCWLCKMLIIYVIYVHLCASLLLQDMVKKKL